jgi:hypothetical protein
VAAGGLAGDSAFGEGGFGEGGDSATGGSTGTSSGGEGGEGGGEPVTCDPASPVAGCVLPPSDSGIYVAPASANGNDDNEGGQDSPVATLARALELAAHDKLPIFVCSGTYDEHVEITTSKLVLRGSYRCDDSVWMYDPNKPSRIAPSAETEALRISNVHGLELDDLELVSVNATTPGASSVAVFVSVSDGVKFTRVHAVAGDGAKGADGRRDQYVYPDPEELKGNDASGDAPGPAQNACPVCEGATSVTMGGRGGLAQQTGAPGEPHEYGGGAGGSIEAMDCTNGSRGGDAPAASDGAGARALGTLTSDGWSPSSGDPGDSGEPGQGGGGGAGAPLSGDGAGGGGACGGCGGKGGQAGTGGGASIAILALGSRLTLTSCVLETGAAGAGGNGRSGQDGQPGGMRGNGSKNACDGGPGGSGGVGGGGGGGAGGISVGVAFTGSSISVGPDSTITPGRAGAAGLGGGDDNAGVPGAAEQLLEL